MYFYYEFFFESIKSWYSRCKSTYALYSIQILFIHSSNIMFIQRVFKTIIRSCRHTSHTCIKGTTLFTYLHSKTLIRFPDITMYIRTIFDSKFFLVFCILRCMTPKARKIGGNAESSPPNRIAKALEYLQSIFNAQSNSHVHQIFKYSYQAHI